MTLDRSPGSQVHLLSPVGMDPAHGFPFDLILENSASNCFVSLGARSAATADFAFGPLSVISLHNSLRQTGPPVFSAFEFRQRTAHGNSIGSDGARSAPPGTVQNTSALHA